MPPRRQFKILLKLNFTEVLSFSFEEKPLSCRYVYGQVMLTKDSLFRFDEGKDIQARLQKVLTYAYEKSEYYGQVR